MDQPLTPFVNLPLPAQCAIEYLSAQNKADRTAVKLDSFIDHYFKAYGRTCEAHIRASCHTIVERRFLIAGGGA